MTLARDGGVEIYRKSLIRKIEESREKIRYYKKELEKLRKYQP